MNYVEHNLGDYAKDTKGLTVLQHGAYRLMLDEYYAHEKPLPLDVGELCRTIGAQSKPEREAVRFVLAKFFVETPDGWWHKRCEVEIEKYRSRSTKARDSANRRWGKDMHPQSDGNANAYANGMPTQSDGNARGAMLPPPTSHTPPPKPRKQKDAPSALSVSDLVAEGIPEQDAADWFEVRRQKRAGGLTARAWASVKAQAEAAGWTLPEVVRKCADKQWRGFEAHWVADEPRPTQRLSVNAAGQNTLDGFVP